MKNLEYVNLIGKNTIFIEDSVKLGKNITIYPGNVILGNSEIEDGVVLQPSNYIKDCKIGKNVEITQSNLENAIVLAGSKIGPFSRVRPNTIIGKNCKIGNFVEIKNSKLGENVKVSHLAYIGDSEVGNNTNIGCGVIFANYNGKEKNTIKVGKNCFIGSNVNLIAPLIVENNTYICAGTTVTQNTKNGDFVIGRVRETIKPKLANKYLKDWEN